MKKQAFRFFTRIVFVISFVMASSIVAIAYPGGSPAGYTGSPGDGVHCTSCHGGSASTVNGWLTSTIPASGYVAGTVYTITATVSGTGKKGFEVSPQNASGAQLGILAAGTNNHLIGGTKYVTQNSSGSSSATVIYNFTWTAPAAGTGAVTFYGAFTVGKTTTKLSTLAVDEDVAVPLSAIASATPALICAGQMSQLSVVPSGGSGSYTYSWSSIPAGFTSAIPNPIVTPSVATQYIAHVSDGSLSADAPTNVEVSQPATAEAGNDTTCEWIVAQVPLNGLAANYSTILWTTSGTGSFDAASALSGYYFPSLADKTAGNVTLTLTAAVQPPCATNAADMRIVNFDWAIGMSKNKGTTINMVMYPNPTNGLFQLKVSGFDNRQGVVTISDITGKTIVSQSFNPSSKQAEQFDLTGYPKGMYLVKFQTAHEFLMRKLVKEN